MATNVKSWILLIGVLYCTSNASGMLSYQICSTYKWSYKGMSYRLANCSGLNLAFVPSFKNIDADAIDLSHNDLGGIERGTFSHLQSLRYLDLSYNKNLTFRILSNLTSDLRTTNITILKLNKIHCTSGIGTMLYDSDVEYLTETNITELYLDQNRLQILDANVLKLLPNSLTFLSLKSNILLPGPYLVNINENTALGLTTVDFSEPMFFDKVNLDIFIICYDWRKRPSTSDSKQNVLQSLGNSTVKIPLPKNLRELYLNDRGLFFSFSKLRFHENVSLEKIHLQRNSFYSLERPQSILKTLKFFDFSYNRCTKIENDFFQSLPYLRTLNLSNNFLSNELQSDTNGNIFGPLNHLETFDISSNRIEALPMQVFQGLEQLLVLNLSYNLLSNIYFNMKMMKNLMFLDLSHNRISSLAPKFREAIDELRNLTINLAGNPLQCTCLTLDTLKWMTVRQSLIKHMVNYTCLYKNNDNYKFTNLQTIIEELEQNCSNFAGLVIGVFVSICLFLVIIFIALGYRYRWRIRYVYLMTRNKYRGYSSIKNNDNTLYEYDAFISYADDDSDFIIRYVQPILENTYNKKLCLHQRDFIAGDIIAANITNAIHKSRKTVIILSKKYLKSYWCMYEFNMARMEKIHSRKDENVMLIIMIEDITARDIPLDMLLVMESESYLKYPKDSESGDFWNNVQRGIEI